MATGTTTQYGADVALQTAFAPGFVNAVYYNNDLLSLKLDGQPVFPMRQAQGDISSERFKVVSSGNTSAEVYTEGAAQNTPVAHTFVNAAIAVPYFRAMVRISGHVRDAVRLGASPDGFNLLDAEFQLSAEAVRDLLTTTMLGATNSGLQVAVDDTASYAGISRGSAGYWESSVSNENGSLTIATMRDNWEAIENVQKAGRPNLLLAAPNQLTNYIALTGDINAQNAAPRVEMTNLSRGAPLDLSPARGNVMFQGAPIVSMRDLTSTVILALDTTPGHFYHAVRRPFDVRAMAPSGDDDVWQLSTASVLVCAQPKKQGKIDGITA